MAIIGHLIRLLARGLKWIGDLYRRLADLFNGVLPVLLSSAQLTELTRNHYRALYSEQFASVALTVGEPYLEPWETEVLDRNKIHSGRMLVLGAGCGRESLALSRRGITVIGVDANEVAIRVASQSAKTLNLQVRFQQADFLALPYRGSSFDYILLSSTMYSMVADAARRQAWLQDLGRLLKPDGLLLLSFLPEHHPVSRRKLVSARLNALLLRLGAANRPFQRGDDYESGHFMHAFQDEGEIRREFIGAGILIRELNWTGGFAVLSYPPLRG